MPSMMYVFSVETFLPVLRTLSGLIDKAQAQLGAEAEALVEDRLAPDMFPFSRQVQIASDMAKSCVARLSGREPPKFEDNEKTLAELKARIDKTIAFIETAKAAEFDGAEARQVTFPLFGEKAFSGTGLRFLKDWALPNFYFHVVTAYDILRHKGVEIGKPDYLAHSGDLILDKAA